MAGSGCLATAFHGELSHGGGSVTVERLRFMAEKAKSDPHFPMVLGNRLFHSGDYEGAVVEFKESRERILRLLETHPADKNLLKELDQLEGEIFEAKQRLST